MTKVIGIDCHKWLRVIGISLWSLATIGLGIVLYLGYDHTFNGYSPYFSAEDCKKVGPHDCWTTYDDSFYYMLVPNIGNILGVWLVINSKYKFIEIKCVSKTTFIEDWVSNGIISNNEFFKQKESS